MFVRNVSQTLINYLKSIGVFVYIISEEYKYVSVINLRWKMYIEFLKKNKNKYNIIFSADVKDTLFQKDIFQNYNFHIPFLGIAIEDGTLNEKVNKRWLINYIGAEKHKKIQNERIICIGTIWGTEEIFLNFTTIFWEKLMENTSCVEQGIVNYLFYYEKIFKDFIIKSDNNGPVMTLGLADSNKIVLDKDLNILNFRGETASVVHQYNRNLGLKKIMISKYCPEIFYFNESFSWNKNIKINNRTINYLNMLLYFSPNISKKFLSIS